MRWANISVRVPGRKTAGWSVLVGPCDLERTAAGLVIHEAQMIPAQGQVFSFHGFRFEVTEKEENHLTRLRISPN